MAELAEVLTAGAGFGPARLLILQSTAFCNIDCSYCYLPHRSDPRRMSLDTVAAAAAFLRRDKLIDSGTTVVWHAGEPLVVPVSWYRQASALLAKDWPKLRRPPSGGGGDTHDIHLLPRQVPPGPPQSVQTNATLIDDEWCDFFRDYAVNVGVSLDGPAPIHDARRRTRSGHGSHAAAMRGVAALRRAGVDCHVICVVGDNSLDAADAIMDFFIGEGFARIAFNVEEIQGVNTVSSLRGADTAARVAAFFDRVLDRAEAAPFAISVREAELIQAALTASGFGNKRPGMEAHPFDIVTISVDGELSTFSPELAGLAGRPGDPAGFFFGNVHRDRLGEIVARSPYRAAVAEIEQGVAACRKTCRYFDVCGGGAPANKLAEHGRFDVTETQFCRLSRQVVADVVLARLERRLCEGRGRSMRRWFVGSFLATVIALSLGLVGPAAAQSEVDLQLVLAVDASGSVSHQRFELQNQGYAAAFRHPRVLQAILSGINQSIAVTMFQWTGPALQVITAKWQLINDVGSTRAFADAIAAGPRQLFGGGTSISGAIDTGVALINDSPYKGARRVIDVSGDGPNNRGRSVTRARDEAVAARIGINGLPILALEPDLGQYYEDNVIGGPGAFVVAAKDYDTFAEAILKKLITEIAGAAPGKVARR